MPSSSSSSALQAHREALQMRICSDWAHREYTELMSGSIKRIADFLSAFDTSCRSRLAILNERLGQLERKVTVLEARVARHQPDVPQELPPDDDQDEKV